MQKIISEVQERVWWCVRVLSKSTLVRKKREFVSENALGQLPPRKIVPRIITPRIIPPPENCPRRRLPPGKLAPHHKISPDNIMGEPAEQNWVPCLKQMSLNIVSCFASKWLKCTGNKWILSIQIMGKCIFVLFRNFFLFNWKAKLVIYYFFYYYFVSPNSCVMLGLETCCCSYLGSIKHTYISMVKQTIFTSQVVQSFSFIFLLSRDNIELSIVITINNSNNNDIKLILK